MAADRRHRGQASRGPASPRLGNFYSSSRAVTGPPGPEVQLTTAQMRSLLTQLNAQRGQTPPDTDVKALQAFIDLLSDALSA